MSAMSDIMHTLEETANVAGRFETASFYMNRDVIKAQTRETIRTVRRKMLEHDVSTLPAWTGEEWVWISDRVVMRMIQRGLVGYNVAETMAIGEEAKKARTVHPEEAIEVIEDMLSNGEPAVLVKAEDTGNVWDAVVGIITPFDLMTLSKG